MSDEPTQPTLYHPLQGTPGDDFRTTRWTQVGQAKADSQEGRRALAELCNAYYEPVVVFLRCELRDADAARELAHDFFAHMLAGGTIARVDQKRGRFRSFLLGAVKHFLSHHREALRRLKRGGGVKHLSLNETEARLAPDAAVLSPDAAFDQQWALTVVVHALGALQRECVSETTGKLDIIYGQQVYDWWFKGSSDLPLAGDTKVAWVGENPAATSAGCRIRVFKSSLINPKPDVRIDAVDFASTLTSSAPFLLALTME